MFSRDGLHYLIAFLIVGGLLTLAWYKQPRTLDVAENRSEESCPYKTYHVGNNPDGGIEFRIERDAESCEGYSNSSENTESPKNEPETLAEADLLAQQQMAHWTRWIGAFTAFGLFVLYVTFNETRRAVVETRKIGTAQTKAYLSIESVKVSTGLECLSLSITLKNFGATAAKDVEAISKLTFAQSEPREPEWINTSVPGVAPKDVQETSTVHTNIPIPRADYGQNFERLQGLSIDMWVFAYDVFGDEIKEHAHRTIERRNVMTWATMNEMSRFFESFWGGARIPDSSEHDRRRHKKRPPKR